METTYQGIDYGLGRANIDPDTGVRYGVISQHSINPDMLAEMEPDYGDPTCPECGNEVRESEPDEGKDYVCSEHGELWSEDCFGDEAVGFTYEQDGYIIVSCLDSGLMVIRSPYVASGQFCSPCVPGAVNLDTPVQDGPEGYALGPDWFDEQNPMPYSPRGL